jgi:hypothetical protein
MKNRDQRWALVWGGLILSALLPALALNIPLFKKLESLDLFAYGIGFLIVVAVVLSVLIEARATETRESVAEVKRVIESLELRVLGGREVVTSLVDRDGFYKQMRQFVEGADTRIDLMYQAPKPPESFRPSEQKALYLATLAGVAEKGRVPIRRIVRLTNDNKVWLRALVEKYSGKKSCSLSVLPESVVPSISVQLFDRNRVVLVNLSESDTRMGRLDLIFESEGLAEVFEIHYETVFKSAESLIENGRKHLVNIGRILA